MRVVVTKFNIVADNIHYWTDSAIVLCWLNENSNKWKTFVGNRVIEVQGLSKIGQWHHVSGVSNPADLVSRSVAAAKLQNSTWFSGPEWLRERYFDSPSPLNYEFSDKELEAKPNQIFTLLVE